MVFQDDSNCAFLYCDESLITTEQTRIVRRLNNLHPTVQVRGAAELRALRLPVTGHSVGRMAVSSGPHTEFQYTGDQPVEAVQSASHGYLPTDTAMHGSFRMSGPGAEGLAAPTELVDAASVIREIWRRRGRKDQ